MDDESLNAAGEENGAFIELYTDADIEPEYLDEDTRLINPDTGEEYTDEELAEYAYSDPDAPASSADTEIYETGDSGEDDEDDGESDADIYELYIEELQDIEPCTPEENRALAIKAGNGDGAARNRLIEGNLRQALMYTADYLNRGVPLADLIQEASIELTMLAGEGYDGAFERLLESRIRARLEEVIEEQQGQTQIAEDMLARVNALQDLSGEMAEELGREPTAAELAERMGVSEDEVTIVMKETMNAMNAVSVAEAMKSVQGGEDK